MSSDGEAEDNTSASSSAASSSDESSSGDSPQTTSAGDVPGKPWRPLRALNAALTHLAEALCHAEARLRQERRAWAEAGADTQRINEGCQQCCYLDVGATPFHTLRDVLTNSGSYFAKAAQPDTETEGTFIDRNCTGHLCLFDDHGRSDVLACRLPDGAWVPHQLRDIDPQGYTCAIGDRLYALGRQGLVSSTLGDAAWRVEPGTPYVSDSTMVAWQGKVLLVGGQDAGAPDGICHLVHVYDPDTQGWSQLPPMRHHRTLPAVAVAEDGALYAVGGGGRCPLPAERYDAATRHWAELGPAPLFRCMAGFAAQL